MQHHAYAILKQKYMEHILEHTEFIVQFYLQTMPAKLQRIILEKHIAILV